MDPTTSELRLPADPSFILIAKRAVAAFASIAEFPLEAVDDLVIAVAQACDNAIDCTARTVGPGRGQIRIVVTLEGRRLEVQVRSLCSRSELAASVARQATAAQSVIAEPVRAGEGAVALTGARTQAGKRRAPPAAVDAEQAPSDMALRLINLFVDDCRYRVDSRTGGLRVRLTKYRSP